MDTRIYVMAHKEFTKPNDELYRALQVGRAISDDLGYESDNTGDNISLKNKNFCELTGLYWIWKNVKCDVVGICHYRRYFVIDEDFIKKEYIEDILNRYDIIVPNSGETEYTNNYEHYKDFHVEKDLNICKEVTLEKYPEYEASFDMFLGTNFASLGNMLITKKTIFDEYCQWLFGILFEVEKRVDISKYDDYQARIFGYLSERLLRVWMFNHYYRIREEEVRMIDPADSENAAKVVDLKYKMTSIILRDITEKYAKGSAYDLIDNTPFNIDFGDKIPVWVCWWQGLDEAPELVKICINSIKKNIPKDKAVLRIVTMENVGDYINLPEWIIEKFESGAITLTHLSDILRASLLYRYGGFWMDATYYLAKPLPDTVFLKDSFYTRRCKIAKDGVDVTKGRWAGNLLRIEPGSVFMRYLLNAFYEYWRIRDDMVDYHLIDYIIALAYDNLQEVRNLIDSCGYSEPEIFTLRELLNKKYDEEVFDSITKETEIFKLTYRDEVYKYTITDEKTFYGYLLEMNDFVV